MSKPKKNKAPLRTKSTRQSLKYEFNAAERGMIGDELAECTRKIAELKDEAKRFASDFKSKIQEKTSRVTVLANELGTGYTFRDTDCTVTYHTPKQGKKTTTRNDTHAVVVVEDMTPYECQEELDLKEAEKKKAEKTPNPVLSEEQASAVKEALEGEAK